MAKVYAVLHYRLEKRIGWRGWLSNLLGLNNTDVYTHVWKIFDTEDKAKDFIRYLVTMDHEFNSHRRNTGLDAHDCELNEEDLVEYGYVDSYWHDENGIRTSVWYSYRKFNVE